MANLKECIECTCGCKTMLPIRFDSEEELLTYKCTHCGKEKTKDIYDVISEDEEYQYFKLTDKGIMCWKSQSGKWNEFPVGHFAIQQLCGFIENHDVFDYVNPNRVDSFESNEFFHPAIAFPVIRAIEGTGYEGRAERIEYIEVGDPLVLKADYESPYYSPVAIEVFDINGGTLGYLRESDNVKELSLAANATYMLRGGVSAKVESVTPRSRRRKNAKYALMDVRISLNRDEYQRFSKKKNVNYDLDRFDIRNGRLVHVFGENEKVIIPDLVKRISPHVFEHPHCVRHLVIPDCVQEIDLEALSDCCRLEELVISDDLLSELFKDGIDKYISMSGFVDRCVRDLENSGSISGIVKKWLRRSPNRKAAIKRYINYENRLRALLNMLEKPLRKEEVRDIVDNRTPKEIINIINNYAEE